MGLRIKTNIASLNAQRRLGESTETIRDSFTKLASGERINRSADDAAGLAISENLKADIRSLNVAKRNASDGISLVQTAEGGLEETSNMLIRLRELAIQSASDTVGQTEREFIDKEYLAIKDEIDRMANATEFNGTKLLIGEANIGDELANAKGTFPMEVHVGKSYFTEADNIENRNQVNIIKIDLSKLNAFTDGEGSLAIGRAEEGTRVNTKSDAQQSITALDEAITRVADYRSYLGAIQNRLGTAAKNLTIQVENMTDARSRIRDVDYAEETARLTQANILQQGGTSVLAAANVQPNIALSLIGALS